MSVAVSATEFADHCFGRGHSRKWAPMPVAHRYAEVSHQIQTYLGKRSGTPTIVLSASLIAGIGLADYLTGYHLSFGLFYVAPVFLLSWYGSRTAGILGSGFCAITWLLANSFTAPQEVDTLILAWNTFIRFGFFVIIASLLAFLRAAYSREAELARIDPLTGLINSRAFRESADRELLRAKRERHPLTVLYLDLDNFKDLNDRLGHSAGDEVLVAFAGLLKRAVRATDLIGRLGGDEFVVLLPDTSRSGGEMVGEKIHEDVSRDTRFKESGISVSIGAVTADKPPSTIDDLLTLADASMYEVKRARRRATGQLP